MRFLKLSISVVLLALVVNAANASAGTGDFYFDDFTADYYLSKDAEGISHLKVVENLTAVFPDYEQNKGICRKIPFTNQNKANVTLSHLSYSDVVLKRNGVTEPIYSIEKHDDNYEVCTGTDDYLLGAQKYTLEYEFTKVVTDFSDYQELYWDTNGNGWFQKFNKVMARVHFVGEVAEAFDGGKWCYVGSYGEKGSERCEISELSDGWQFSAKNLDRFENLTFDVEFKPGTFKVPAPEKNYLLWLILAGVVLICGLAVWLKYRKFRAVSEKRKFYKDYFIKPEYQPNASYNVAEMTANYIGDKKDSKIGVLLEMIVKKQILIIKNPKKKKDWKIKVEKYDEISEAGRTLLKILNGGETVESGEEIEVKKHTATASLAKIGRNYYTGITSLMKKLGLVSSEYTTVSGGSELKISEIIIYVAIVVVVSFLVSTAAVEAIKEEMTSGVLDGEELFPVLTAIAVSVTAFIILLLVKGTKKYAMRTMKGLEVSRYMDGLKLYIKMAEAERMKMLQSVEGADTSPEGVVHLYEKLLPYAAVFGLEKSWLKEMEKYYKVAEVEDSAWGRNDLSMSDVLIMSNLATRYANQSVSFGSSGSGIAGGGSFSSGFSGGGGGGFSGGGGGGGGGGGR